MNKLLILICYGLLALQALKIGQASAMEKEIAKKEEAEIIMPSALSQLIIATFKAADMPKREVVAGDVQLVSDDDKTETVPRSAADLSETLRNVISDVGTAIPLPIHLTGDLFTKLVESLKALNTITTTRTSQYSNALVKLLQPLLSKMTFEQMQDLFYESNRLDIKPLTWYLIALFATEIYENKDLSIVSRLTKALARQQDLPNLIAKQVETIMPQGVSWKLSIPAANLRQMAVKFVPQKGIIALTDTQTNLYLWNLAESAKKVQKVFKRTEVALSLMMTDDGTRALALLPNGTLRVWDLETGTIITELASPIFQRAFAALSHDGKYVLANSSGGTVDLWDLENNTVRPLVRLQGVLLKFSPGNDYALIGLADKTVHYVNIRTGQTKKVLIDHAWSLSSASFSSDGKYVLTGSRDGTAILWDLTQEGEELKPSKIFNKYHMGPVTAVAISPDNNYALTASESMIYLWNLKSDEPPLPSYAVLGERVFSLAFSSNGKYGLIGSRIVVLWSLSEDHTLPEVVLFMKLNQQGKRKVVQDPYFKELYDRLIGY